MKVLIVDDEPHLIHAIKALVPWQEYDIDKVLSATTAAEAVSSRSWLSLIL